MRILWASNWSAQSAYALQSRLFVPRMMADGHNVTVFEISSSARSEYDMNGIRVVPTALDPMGNDIIEYHAAQTKADAVMTFVDIWRFNPPTWANVPFYPYVPIDHLPVPPAVVDRLKVARRAIAMAQFGAAELRKVGVDPLYCPLAVDTATFVRQDKAACRRVLGLPEDKFIPLFVGVNDSIPSRKGIEQLLMAWQLFSARRKDAVLYMHTAVNGYLPVNTIGGINIERLMATLAIDPDTIRFTEQGQYRVGITQSAINTLLNAADVLVLPSRGEGFGVPLIEAQSIGVPVITTDFAAGAELVYAGWKVPYTAEWGYQEAFLGRIDVNGLVEALDAAYQARGDERLAQVGIEAMRAYHIDHVYPAYMRPVLAALAEDALERRAA